MFRAQRCQNDNQRLKCKEGSYGLETLSLNIGMLWKLSLTKETLVKNAKKIISRYKSVRLNDESSKILYRMAESELPITLIVQITLTIIMKKVSLKYPLANPKLEINLHGPNLRNLVIPKPAESIEDKNVNLNKIAPSPITLFGSCLKIEAIGDKTMI